MDVPSTFLVCRSSRATRILPSFPFLALPHCRSNAHVILPIPTYIRTTSCVQVSPSHQCLLAAYKVAGRVTALQSRIKSTALLIKTIINSLSNPKVGTRSLGTSTVSRHHCLWRYSWRHCVVSRDLKRRAYSNLAMLSNTTTSLPLSWDTLLRPSASKTSILQVRSMAPRDTKRPLAKA